MSKELEILKLKRKLLLESNILAWGKYYFEPKFFRPFCLELHNYFIDIRNKHFTATLAPRGTAKTTIKCFLIPLYMALVNPSLYKYYLNVQNTATKAISINIAIKNELETNEKLIENYGLQVSKEGKWTESLFVLNNGVIFGACGAGQSIRGLQYNNTRPDYAILDDFYDDEDASNPNRILKKNNWFWATLYPALAEKHCIHVQGTAIHKTDLIHQLKDKPGVVFKKFQAVKNWDTKEVLYKEFESFDKLLNDKELQGSAIFNREKQNDCRDDETSLIKEHWISFYDEIPTDVKIIKTYIGVDPSVGANDKSDYTGICVISVSDTENIYINQLVNERLTFDARIQAVKNLNEVYKPYTVAIEAISAFQDFADQLKNKTKVPVKSIKSVANKLVRLENQQGRFEHGKVFINNKIDKRLKDELVYQLINNHPEHDDLRDSFLTAVELLTKENTIRLSVF